MATQAISVTSGTQVGPFAVTPTMSITGGTQVQGGTMLIETAPTQNGPWTQWAAGASTSSATIRPTVNQWIRATAGGSQNGVLVIADLGLNNSSIAPFTANPLCSINIPLDTPNSTSEVLLHSIKIPAGYLPPNFRLEVHGIVSVTNNANVKTLKLEVNGLGGTSIFTSPSLASNLNYAFTAAFAGIGDGATLKGLGAGTTGGLGLSTTAVTTLAFAYLTTDLEVAITATKATGTDTMKLESAVYLLY